jgi:PadR family transcriptional regulator, regulatory protein AphA
MEVSMSLKHAILGFLSFNPLSGYDLKKAFDQSVRHFWPANQSQIYRTLAELDEEGFVEKEVIPREERLDMKVYSITDTGREELRRWLSTPLPPQDYREPALIQVYFGGKLTDEELIRLLNHGIQSLEERLAIYESIYEMNQEAIHTVEDLRASVLMVSTLEYGILSNRAALDWLKSVVERVRSRNYALQEL